MLQSVQCATDLVQELGVPADAVVDPPADMTLPRYIHKIFGSRHNPTYVTLHEFMEMQLRAKAQLTQQQAKMLRMQQQLQWATAEIRESAQLDSEMTQIANGMTQMTSHQHTADTQNPGPPPHPIIARAMAAWNEPRRPDDTKDYL